MRRSYFAAWSLWALIGLAGGQGANADAPSIIPIRGFLTDAAGAAVDGKHRISLWLYDSESGGSVLYTDDHLTALDEGHFILYLGANDSSPLDLATFKNNAEVWLEIIIDGDEIVQPRTRLGSVPFAGLAQYCAEAAHAEHSELATRAMDAMSLQGSNLEALDTRYVNSQGDRVSGELRVNDLSVHGTLSTDCQLVTCSGGDWVECACPAGKYIQTGGCNAQGSPGYFGASRPTSLTQWQCGGHGGPKQINLICCRQR
jgi:hypothetical protein